MERDGQGRVIVKLDGSFGLGFDCRVTIITRDLVTGEAEKTYEFPYSCVNFKELQARCDANLILGYRVVKIIPAEAEANLVVFSGGEAEE